MHAVTTYYLEINSASELLAKDDSRGLVVRECASKQFEINRFLYVAVGGDWHWTDKLSWTDEQWRAYAEDDNLRTWVAWFKGSPAGYYELQQQEERVIEIAYFGLLPQFVGMGFGGYLLTHAIRSAWDAAAARVWVHTCTLDHPRALANYEARGMKVYCTEKEEQA